MSDDIEREIAELEESLKLPLPPTVRQQLEARLRELHARRAIVPPVTTGVANVNGTVYGNAIGVNLGKIIYGRDVEEDERRRIVWYLDSLANKLYRLPLRGIEQRLDQGEGMALPHVYVALAVQSGKRVAHIKNENVEQLRQYFEMDSTGAPIKLHREYDKDWSLPQYAIMSNLAEMPISLDLDDEETDEEVRVSQRFLARAKLVTECVEEVQRLVLLGDPGGGKSTFLRHLAWALAQRGLDQIGQVPTLFGWSNDVSRLPLLLPLRSLAGAIVTQGTQPAVVASSLSAELTAQYNVGQAPALVEQALHSGAALLLFDGLDEVPLEGVPGRRADRRTVLRVVREFAQLYRNARIVVTCRTRAFDDTLRAELGWQVETIAPFTLGQIRHFVPAWYGELVAAGQIEQSQAVATGAKLIDAITDPRRASLRVMAENPLLLTMMALVLYNQGELPRDRPQLYERILNLLLGQWDKVREGQSLAEAVGMPAWESRDFLPLLDRLCYEAHRDATSVDGRGRLNRGTLYTALIDFFRQARVPQPGEAALCCLDYFEQRSGLLAADTQDTYVFAHLTLQEHGAARYMAVQSDDPTGLMLRHRADDRWREPVMLGAGLLRPADLNTLLTDLIDVEEQGHTKPAERWQKDLILAAEIGVDRDWNLLRTRSAIKVDRLQRDLKHGLVELLNDSSQPLLVADRVRAGFLLGDLGDTRIPVTLDEWRREIEGAGAGATIGYFCRIEPSAYIIGSADDDPDASDDEKPQHIVTFDVPFWIGRYPITNAQWQVWVDAGGKPAYYAEDRDLNRSNQPVVGVTWQMCGDFCAWLSEQLGVSVRLPTEFEWEAAGRGSTARRYPWGNEWKADRVAMEADQKRRGAAYTVPVGCYPAGQAPCGALDMSGNVWEWTSNEWQSYPGSAKPFANTTLRVLRGGCYSDNQSSMRCGERVRVLPTEDRDGHGLRVVLSGQREL